MLHDCAQDVMPEGLWREQRVEALIEVLARSIENGNWPYPLIETWALELAEHARWKRQKEESSGIPTSQPN